MKSALLFDAISLAAPLARAEGLNGSIDSRRPRSQNQDPVGTAGRALPAPYPRGPLTVFAIEPGDEKPAASAPAGGK